MNDLQIFTNPTFGQVRAVQIDGEPWFVAADVCKALEIGNPRQAVARLDDDERGVISTDTPGYTQEMNAVNEPGLYGLVLGSRKPEAKAFKRWITHEVIPSIRRNGGYIAGQENLTDAELLARAVLVAQKTIEERTARIAALEKQAALNAPKVLFADAVAVSDNAILVGELAKILVQNGVPNMGQNRLFKWMREEGYLTRRNGTDYNIPTQKSMEMGLFQMKETAVTHSDGHVSIKITSKVTGKGQTYFVNLFLKERGLPSLEEQAAEREYRDALEQLYQDAPGMAVCEKEHAGKKYLCIPAEAARKALEERGVDAARFMLRVKREERLRVGQKGCAIATRVGENVTKCYWLAAR